MQTMNITKRQPVSAGEMITEEFLVPMALTQAQLAEAMGVSRKTVNELCTNRRAITVDTALMLATVFGNTADFWLNLQQRNELWKALNTPKRRARIGKAKPIEALQRTVAKRKSYSFADAHVQVGDTLVYARDESITATVVSDKKIRFEGKVTSLSGAALTLLRRDGYKWGSADGWGYWMKDGETLGARVKRFAPVDEDD